MKLVKKLLFTGMIISVLFTGCKKDKKTDYASLILGVWLNTLIDNNPVLTDNSYVIEFRSNQVESYAKGFVLDSNNKTWIENAKYNYTVDGDMIIIDGIDDPGNSFHMEFKILSIDQQILSYSVRKFIINNIEYPDQKIYNCKKMTADLTKQFIGTWYGKSTTPGSTDTSNHYWDYFANGHYDYYYRDGGGNWINKPDNEGFYFLYGDFLASNYTNDLIIGGKGKSFECWNISIAGDTMFWTGFRDNGLATSFRMEKAPGPPGSFAHKSGTTFPFQIYGKDGYLKKTSDINVKPLGFLPVL